ncbi:hypothetical protein Q9L58_008569 [Maublancomyces gigas]|uniref:Transposase n=1 Tax=Discina gigas TaxID=1032678 RepID=A0ABR3G9C2_9PEZI
MTFHAISAALGVNERTASGIVRRAKDRAADPEDFEDVLVCLEDEHGGGMPARIAENSDLEAT